MAADCTSFALPVRTDDRGRVTAETAMPVLKNIIEPIMKSSREILLIGSDFDKSDFLGEGGIVLGISKRLSNSTLEIPYSKDMVSMLPNFICNTNKSDLKATKRGAILAFVDADWFVSCNVVGLFGAILKSDNTFAAYNKVASAKIRGFRGGGVGDIAIAFPDKTAWLDWIDVFGVHNDILKIREKWRECRE